MKLSNALLICSSILIASSCKRNIEEGHGKITSENRNVSGFTAVTISAPMDATITVDNTKQASVSLKGYANLLEKITTKVENGVLVIDKDDLIDFFNDDELHATIVVPSLEALTIAGASDADIKGAVTGAHFKLKVSGAGDVTIDKMSASDFESELSGAGDLHIKGGEVNNASFRVTGAGDVSAYAMRSKNVTAKVAGAGDVEVSVSDNLEAKVTGVGSISYKGHPQVQSDVSGIGEVEDDN
jgi:hypothetical protein